MVCSWFTLACHHLVCSWFIILACQFLWFAAGLPRTQLAIFLVCSWSTYLARHHIFTETRRGLLIHIARRLSFTPSPQRKMFIQHCYMHSERSALEGNDIKEKGLHLRNFDRFCFRVRRKEKGYVWFWFLDFVVLPRVSVSVVSFTCTLLLIPRREKGNEKGDVSYRPIASAEPRQKTRKCLHNTPLALCYMTKLRIETSTC